MKTKPELFIIESLSLKDEKKKRFEGRIISDILSLNNKQCDYFYIRTKRELRRILNVFTASSYRYLHISCHGNENGMSTTLDDMAFQEFAEIVRPHLRFRRLFLSACSGADNRLASLLMPGSDCRSILGPDQDVYFSDAAILWASLYHMMFKCDHHKMNSKVLQKKAQAVANMYEVQLNYFGRDQINTQDYVTKRIVPKSLA